MQINNIIWHTSANGEHMHCTRPRKWIQCSPQKGAWAENLQWVKQPARYTQGGAAGMPMQGLPPNNS
jgi:hypothetical protein